MRRQLSLLTLLFSIYAATAWKDPNNEHDVLIQSSDVKVIAGTLLARPTLGAEYYILQAA